MAETKTYIVKRDGFLLGDWRNRNTQIPLTEAQARPFLRDGTIVLKDEPEPKARAEGKG